MSTTPKARTRPATPKAKTPKKTTTKSKTGVKTQKPKVVMTLVYANWCPHCVSFMPVWEKFKNSEMGKTVNFREVDFDSIRNLTRSSPLKSISTVPHIQIKTVDSDGKTRVTPMNGVDRTVAGLDSFVKTFKRG